MSDAIDNALIRHGGEPEMPRPAIRAILTDAGCVSELTLENEALRRQNAALEEANQSLANERDRYRSQCHRLEDRLAGREYE